MNKLELDHPTDPAVKYVIQAKENSVVVYKQHTTSDTATISDNVTEETVTITRTTGQTINF